MRTGESLQAITNWCARRVSGARGVAVDRTEHVLAGIVPADVEHEAIAQAGKRASQCLLRLLARADQRREAVGDAAVDDGDAAGVDSEVLDRVGRGLLGDREGVVGPPQQAEAGEVGRLGDRLGLEVAIPEDQRDEVVESDHGSDPRRPRPARPDVFERGGQVHRRGDVMDRRQPGGRRKAVGRPVEPLRADHRIQHGGDRQLGIQVNGADHLGGQLVQRRELLADEAADAALGVVDALRALGIDPDAPGSWAHSLLGRD